MQINATPELRFARRQCTYRERCGNPKGKVHEQGDADFTSKRLKLAYCGQYAFQIRNARLK
jgi:hypothetical protein